MKCIRGQFFTVDDLVDDENMVRMEIYNRIKPFVTSSVAKKATQLMEALKLGNRKRLHLSASLFYGKAIVENEN